MHAWHYSHCQRVFLLASEGSCARCVRFSHFFANIYILTSLCVLRCKHGNRAQARWRVGSVARHFLAGGGRAIPSRSPARPPVVSGVIFECSFMSMYSKWVAMLTASTVDAASHVLLRGWIRRKHTQARDRTCAVWRLATLHTIPCGLPLSWACMPHARMHWVEAQSSMRIIPCAHVCVR